MKLLTIRFDNAVNLLEKGTAVSVSDGTTLINGVIMMASDVEEVPTVPHAHEAAVQVTPGSVTVVVGPSAPIPD